MPSFRLAPENKYLYNGKEKQDVLVNMLDYGARFYDPVIARWTSVDPNVEDGQESTSPYGYVFDDPMRFTDPDGRAPEWIKGNDGKPVSYTVNSDGTLNWSKNASFGTQVVGML